MAFLTVAVFEDTEKPKRYLENFLASLKQWNERGMAETEVVVVTQKATTESADLAVEKSGIAAKVVKSDNPFVDGHPVWDVMADLRKARKYFTGEYLTVNHSEFLWCRLRLSRTIEWLKANRPYLALGNLRRPGRQTVARPRWRPGNCDRFVSEPLSMLLDRGDWKRGADHAENMPTLIWPLWKANIYKFGICRWSEDVFFADREWIENWRAFDHGGPLPFQDVFDLMGAAIARMAAKKLDPQIIRMTEDVNRIIHRWHPKGYESWTPAVRDWFLADFKRWNRTAFSNRKLWDRLLTLNGEKNTDDQYAKFDLRRGPAGTVTRYEEAVRAHIINGGFAEMRRFYERNGWTRRNVKSGGSNSADVRN